MQSIKDYNNKLKSLKNTQKITKTMKMVAASKLRKAQQAQVSAKSYAVQLTELISRIVKVAQSSDHPLLVEHKESKKALILVYTSDKGLCGAFNHNAHKHVLQWISENKERFTSIDLSFCGKRGFEFFKSQFPVAKYYENVTGVPTFQNAELISKDLMTNFLSRKYDEIYLVYNQFFSPLSQKTIFEKVLPLNPAELLHTDEVEAPNEYVFEPQSSGLLEYLIPHFIYFKVYFALLENSAGEHGARMSAMDNATKNASELIDQTTLLRNRARQAAITTELTEIVAGAEAL